MKVILKRDLFLDGTLYPHLPYPTDIPNQYKDKLPKDAKIIGDDVKEPIYISPNTLRDFDEVRANGDAFDKRKLG